MLYFVIMQYGDEVWGGIKNQKVFLSFRKYILVL